MVAKALIEKIPWKKIAEELAKAAPFIIDKVKVELEKRKEAKEHQNKAITSIDGRVINLENDLRLLENNVTSNSEVLIKIQEQINLINSGMSSFNFRQNILIGVSLIAVVLSIISIIISLIH